MPSHPSLEGANRGKGNNKGAEPVSAVVRSDLKVVNAIPLQAFEDDRRLPGIEQGEVHFGDAAAALACLFAEKE